MALALAYALVGQLVLAGAAMSGVAAAQLSRAPGAVDFRTLFCRPSANAGGADTPAGSSTPGCCLAGCGMLAGTGPLPEAVALANLTPRFLRLARLGVQPKAPPAEARRAPHQPRAPPMGARSA